MVASTWLKMCLKLLLLMCCLITTGSAIRADLQKGFEMCSGKQLGRVVSVDADGPGCKRRNGQPQWPCFVQPGRDGIFSISYIHEQPSGFNKIDSSINGIVKLFGIKRRFPVKGERKEDACPYTYYRSDKGPSYGCPIYPNVVYTIEKTVTVPSAVIFAQQNMNVEFKLTDNNGNNIICFKAPMINL